VNWIIETKGRVWEGTANKDAAIEDWCNRITDSTGELWKFKRIDQVVFNRHRSARLLADLVDVGNRLV
jgi:type III restriction enzyme